MEKHPVALIPIATYDQAAVDAAVLQGVDLLGGIARFVQPEERILLKPNLLSRALPQKAITTHPAVFSAVCRLLRESGYTHLSYGDSPGNPTTSPDKAAQASGIAEAAKRYGVEMADFFSGSVVPFPDGHTAKSFYLCKGVQDADAMINICKMKTHALERITGAVKNLYGCITGVNKAAGHAAYPDSWIFADMLTDLHRCVRPRLHIHAFHLPLENGTYEKRDEYSRSARNDDCRYRAAAHGMSLRRERKVLPARGKIVRKAAVPVVFAEVVEERILDLLLGVAVEGVFALFAVIEVGEGAVVHT